jgi:hypothetical protein
MRERERERERESFEMTHFWFFCSKGPRRRESVAVIEKEQRRDREDILLLRFGFVNQRRFAASFQERSKKSKRGRRKELGFFWVLLLLQCKLREKNFYYSTLLHFEKPRELRGRRRYVK